MTWWCQPTYLLILVSVHSPCSTRSSSDHLLPHLSELQTILFNMQHPTFGINSLILSVSLIHILVFHLLTSLHTSDPHCHHHHCHNQSLLFFNLELKSTTSWSLFHRRFLHRYSLDWSHRLLDCFSLAHWFCFSSSRDGKYRDIFENIENIVIFSIFLIYIRYIYSVHFHTAIYVVSFYKWVMPTVANQYSGW